MALRDAQTCWTHVELFRPHAQVVQVLTLTDTSQSCIRCVWHPAMAFAHGNMHALHPSNEKNIAKKTAEYTGNESCKQWMLNVARFQKSAWYKIYLFQIDLNSQSIQNYFLIFSFQKICVLTWLFPFWCCHQKNKLVSFPNLHLQKDTCKLKNACHKYYIMIQKRILQPWKYHLDLHEAMDPHHSMFEIECSPYKIKKRSILVVG